MYDTPIYLQGIAVDPSSGAMVQLGYEFVECLQCGALISTDKKELHDGFHSETQYEAGVANPERTQR